MTPQILAGALAGILLVPAFGLYVFSIIKRTTKPNRVTWWILALISTVVVLSYHGVGARNTIWLPIAYAAGYIFIALLSLKYGDGPFSLSILDRVSLAGGVVSAVAYWFAQSPQLALLLSVLTEFIALVPTAVKSYEKPETEDRWAWIIGTIASLVNLFAIGEWSLGIAGYPIWVFLSNAVITSFILGAVKQKPTS